MILTDKLELAELSIHFMFFDIFWTRRDLRKARIYKTAAI